MGNFKPGDKAFIVESNRTVREVTDLLKEAVFRFGDIDYLSLRKKLRQAYRQIKKCRKDTVAHMSTNIRPKVYDKAKYR